MANSTAGTISGHILNILRTQGDTTDIPALQESFLLTLIGQANMEYRRAHRRGAGDSPDDSFRDGGFSLVSDTKIDESGGLATTDTEFNVDDSSSYNATGGAIAIWKNNTPDIVFYTTNDLSKNFSGVTEIGYAKDDNNVVQKLYKLPSTFKSFTPADEYGDGVQVNNVPLRYRKGEPNLRYFTTRTDGTNTFLWVNRGLTGTINFLSEKTSTVIDDTSDRIDVPPEYEFFVVWRAIETATIPKEGSEISNLYVVAVDKANKILKESLLDVNIGDFVRVRQFRRLDRRRYDPSLYQRVPR